ncbi:MAG: hypothetical protein LBS36_02265 [Oscillospiraceae bacterium]|jgi:hypothetical protein|nr:hypothetical protein [Oscillospiraceae bacterium]
MDKKNKKSQKRQIVSNPAVKGYRSAVANGNQNWDVIESDVLGSYTGTGEMDPHPVQDADDL